MKPKPLLTPEQLLELLKSLPEQIPDFAIVSAEELRRIRRPGYDLDGDLEREVLGAVRDSDLVQQVVHSTSDDLRQARDEVARWESAEAQLRLVLRGLTTANAIRRKRIADAIQLAARVSSGTAGNARHYELAPHVENIRQIRKRKRRK